MIVGDHGLYLDPGMHRPTLDDLFRRAAVRNPDTIALADPDNRATFTDGAPRSLTYAQADRAIWAIAQQLRATGLRDDAVVALQLPNTVESVLTVLAILRAGLIAAPLPMLWRESEIIAALSGVRARALITTSRIGKTAHCDIAFRAAAGLLSIRQVFAFGSDVPDGVVALAGAFSTTTPDLSSLPLRADAAVHAAIVTFEPSPRGLLPMVRNHTQLVAAGSMICAETALAADSPILSPVPITSFAGTAVTLLPWLVTGGRLVLHQPFDAELFAEQRRDHNCNVVIVPGPLARVFERDVDAALIALWRAPERIDATPWPSETPLTDVMALGEFGVFARKRTNGGGVMSIRTRRAGDTLETNRTAAGTLAVRGAMVVRPGMPIDADPAQAPLWQGDGFIDTLYPCRTDEAGGLHITGPQPAMTGIGGYRIARGEIEALTAGLPADSILATLPDALLGQRLKGRAADLAATQAALEAANPLVSGAFQRPPPA